MKNKYSNNFMYFDKFFFYFSTLQTHIFFCLFLVMHWAKTVQSVIASCVSKIHNTFLLQFFFVHFEQQRFVKVQNKMYKNFMKWFFFLYLKRSKSSRSNDVIFGCFKFKDECGFFLLKQATVGFNKIN